MPGPMRQFRLFVSSTFGDLKAERDALRQRVFPRLRDVCRAHAATFQAVDLRWGVSREASEDQSTMQICLDEVDRCRGATEAPNFVALLGERYGWRPLPEEIPGNEYEEIHTFLSEGSDDTGLELLNQWYKLDTNAVPPVYVLIPRKGEYARDDRWRRTERDLIRTLRTAVEKLRFAPRQRRRYLASATEREIAHRGLLDEGDPTGSVFCFVRKISGLPRDRRAAGYLDFDAEGNPDEEGKELQERLKIELSRKLGSGVTEYAAAWAVDALSTDHIDPFCEAVFDRLSRIIRHELSETGMADPLETEIQAHRAFAGERTRFFVGRTASLEHISDYLQKPAQHPFIIYGDPGSGKSTLIAKAVSGSGPPPNENILFRFIGAAPGSANVRTLLQSLCRELKRCYHDSDTTVADEHEELVREFSRLLRRATKAQPLTMYLDALDQLSTAHNARALTWLPTRLPEHVHLVVSTLPGDCLDVLKRKVPESYCHPLTGMSADEGHELLEAWLQEAGRTLQDSQRRTVLDAYAANGLPLYLRLAFEEARQWHSDTPPIEFAPVIPGIIRDLFARLSAPARHGPTMVSRALSYLAAGKNGLSWDEMLEVLSDDREVMEPLWADSFFPIGEGEPLPAILWSRLYYDLRPYLTERMAEGVATLDFYHGQLREVVEQDYLKDDVQTDRHRMLAQFFGRARRRAEEEGTKWSPSERELSEWPYQLACAESWHELHDVLMDFEFLQAKNSVAGSQALIEDFDFVLETDRLARAKDALGNIEQLTAVRDAIRAASQTVSAYPEQLASQLCGRLLASGDAAVRRLTNQVSQWSARPWLRPLNASLYSGALRFALRGHKGSVRSLAVTADGRLCATAGNSHPDQTVRIWDLDAGRALHVLTDQAEPGGHTPIAFTGDQEHLVFGNGNELVVCSVATGLEQCRLREHETTIRALAVAARAPRAVSADDSGVLSVWNLLNWALEQRLPIGTEAVELLALSPDGTRAVALSPSGLVVWDLNSGEIDAELHEDLNSFDWWSRMPLAFSDDGLTVYYGHSLKCWKVPEGPVETLLRQGDSIMEDGAVRSVLAVAPEAGRVLVSPLEDHVGDMYLSPDTHNSLAVRNLATHETLVALPPQGSDAISCALSADGNRAVVAHSDHSVRVWNVEKRGETALRGHNNPVALAHLSNDGRRAMTNDQGNQVRFWDLATGCQIDGDDEGYAELNDEWRAWFERYDADPDNDFNAQQRHKRKKVRRGTPQKWAYAKDAPIAVCFEAPTSKFGEQVEPPDESPDQIRICMDIWELDENHKPSVRRHRASGRPRGSPLTNVRVTRDGRVAVSAGWGSLRAWDLKTGRQRCRLEGHTGPVWDIVLADNDRKAVTISEDATVRLWDLANGDLIATFTCESPLHAIEATTIRDNDNDFLTIIAGEDSGRVHILRLETR